MGLSESNRYGSGESIFVLYETCQWRATCFDKSMINTEKSRFVDTAIPTFPILPNEEFAFNYSDRNRIELE